jgi:hypothetical protein
MERILDELAGEKRKRCGLVIIPDDAIIREEKVRDYLLKPLFVDDKSHFLTRAGYTREEYWELIRDIRDQLLPGEGLFQERRDQGMVYVLRGTLRGPNGRDLSVKTIGLQKWSGAWSFVTLFPDKKART